jgi:hypothetical protein
MGQRVDELGEDHRVRARSRSRDERGAPPKAKRP